MFYTWAYIIQLVWIISLLFYYGNALDFFACFNEYFDGERQNLCQKS